MDVFLFWVFVYRNRLVEWIELIALFRLKPVFHIERNAKKPNKTTDSRELSLGPTNKYENAEIPFRNNGNDNQNNLVKYNGHYISHD